jgi:hypothetical protein
MIIKRSFGAAPLAAPAPASPTGRPTVRTALPCRPERPGARRSTALHGGGWGWTGAAGWGRVARREALE